MNLFSSYFQRYQRLSAVDSNACKFTPFGGKLTVKTRLIIPALPTRLDDIDNEVLEEKRIDVEGDVQRPLSTSYLSQHDKQQGRPSNSLEWIAVRIEVTDTGYGIKAQDMAQSKLFCKYILFCIWRNLVSISHNIAAFNQTEQGRQQGW